MALPAPGARVTPPHICTCPPRQTCSWSRSSAAAAAAGGKTVTWSNSRAATAAAGATAVSTLQGRKVRTSARLAKASIVGFKAGDRPHVSKARSRDLPIGRVLPGAPASTCPPPASSRTSRTGREWTHVCRLDVPCHVLADAGVLGRAAVGGGLPAVAAGGGLPEPEAAVKGCCVCGVRPAAVGVGGPLVPPPEPSDDRSRLRAFAASARSSAR